MDPEQAARAALRVLTKNETFDPRELRRALLRKLKATLREEGLTEVADDEVEEAEEDLPATMEWDTPLATLRMNVYRAVPPGLNSWETAFAALLDADAAGTVRWWHRNLPQKAWSVQVVLSDGRGFFPDFVVGIEGRNREDNALLADPKFAS